MLIALAVTVVVLGRMLSKKNSKLFIDEVGTNLQYLLKGTAHARKNEEIEVDENTAYGSSAEAVGSRIYDPLTSVASIKT